MFREGVLRIASLNTNTAWHFAMRNQVLLPFLHKFTIKLFRKDTINICFDTYIHNTIFLSLNLSPSLCNNTTHHKGSMTE